MGNSVSNTRRVEALLDIISETVVSANSQCLANAENFVLIDTNGAQNVTVRNLFIDQVSDATVDCTNNTTIEVAPMQLDLKKRLEEMIQLANNTDADASDTKVKLVNDIVNSVNESVVSRCLAEAVNRYEATAEDVSGNVNIVDLDINQMAEAQMKSCLNSTSIKVGDKSLKEHLEAELPKYNLVPPAGKSIPCEDIQRMRQMAVGAVIAALVLSALLYLMFA